TRPTASTLHADSFVHIRACDIDPPRGMYAERAPHPEVEEKQSAYLDVRAIARRLRAHRSARIGLRGEVSYDPLRRKQVPA
ncbi:MAG TPA: hypothetical protein VKU41_10720, partial [Polyangiaceae bacterium]|nr:hypothetical protein [Polyangiaceae bacterium]